MKRTIPLVLLLGLVLTGCKLRADANVTINEDESGTLGVEVSLDEELRDVLTRQGGAFDLSTTLDQLPDRWTVEEFTEGEFEGARASVGFDSLADLESILDEASTADLGGGGSPSDLLSNVQIRREGDRFFFEAAIDDVEGTLTEAIGGEDTFGGLDLATLFDTVFEIRLIVAMPGEVESHNGDAVDLSTVTWNIDLTTAGATLRAESVIAGAGANLAIVGIIAAVVVGGALAFVIAQRRNTRRAEELVAAATDAHTLEEPPTA